MAGRAGLRLTSDKAPIADRSSLPRLDRVSSYLRTVLRFAGALSPPTVHAVRNLLVTGTVLTAWGALVANAQTPEQTKPDISNKALLVKPGATLQGRAEAGALHKLADDYYDWRNEQYPVRSSDAGLHTWDDRLTDYSPEKIAERALHVRAVLDQVNAMPTANWPKDERIDWILFRSQLESAAFDDRVWHSTSRDPQTYVGECSNGIFSLLKKEYDTPQKTRARAPRNGFSRCRRFSPKGEKNLQKPVKLFAELAIASARAIDPLFNESLMTLATDLSPDEKEGLVKARDGALAALHDFADHLEKGLPSMVAFAPMGEENYNYYLHHVLLLPLDAAEVEMIGRVELAQYRAYEAWLPDPSLADPDPKRSKNIPPDQASFLKAYESREAEMIRFLKDRRLVTLPDYLGKFEIRQLPEAFKPTSPGGFMNPPGVYDKDPAGFLFHPDIQPGLEELLHPRGDRRSAADSRARGNSRTFPPALDREPREGRNSPAKRRQPLRRRLGALRRGNADATAAFIRSTRPHRDRFCGWRAIARRGSAWT